LLHQYTITEHTKTSPWALALSLIMPMKFTN